MKTKTKFLLALALTIGMLTSGPLISTSKAQYYGGYPSYYGGYYDYASYYGGYAYPSYYGSYSYSDARLKRDFSPISGSLKKINELQAYHYFWKDATKDQSIQTGLIAQEVEKLLPELVKTDSKGIKSVNYVGLIPHLIESVKQLTEQNELLKAQNKLSMDQSMQILSKLEELEAKMNPGLKTAAQQENKTK